MKLEDVPAFMIRQFEAGDVPCDEPPGLTEHAYRVWKEAGGAVKEKATADQWAVVELMGHVRLAGRLTQVELFGSKMGRLDIPTADGQFVTKLFGGSSVYAITYVDEAAARIVATASRVEPVHSWEMPKQLPAAPKPARQSGEYDAPDPDDAPYKW